MTTKADFNAEEWERVLQGPAIAGLIVVAAQRGGTIREGMQMAKEYREARELTLTVGRLPTGRGATVDLAFGR